MESDRAAASLRQLRDRALDRLTDLAPSRQILGRRLPRIDLFARVRIVIRAPQVGQGFPVPARQRRANRVDGRRRGDLLNIRRRQIGVRGTGEGPPEAHAGVLLDVLCIDAQIAGTDSSNRRLKEASEARQQTLEAPILERIRVHRSFSFVVVQASRVLQESTLLV